MTKLCPRGKAAAKRKFKVYPSAYANAYASKICAGKIKDPSGVKRKDFRGPKPAAKGGMMPPKDKDRVSMRDKELSNKKKSKQKIDPNKGVTYDRPRGMIGRKPVFFELNKGGGADTGTIGEERSKIGVAINKITRQVKAMPSGTRGREDALKKIKRLRETSMRRGNIKRKLDRAKDFQQGRRELFKSTAGKNIPVIKKGGMTSAYTGSYIKSEIDGKKISNKSYEKYYKGMI